MATQPPTPPEQKTATLLDVVREKLGEVCEITPQLQNELIEFVEGINLGHKSKISLLQLQTGVFRLLQGSAYRVYTVKYSLNYHTHREVKSLPFTWRNFVCFVTAAIELYRGVLIEGGSLRSRPNDEKYHKVLDDLIATVEAQDLELKRNIENFDVSKLDEEQLRCHNSILESRQKTLQAKENITEYAERALFQRKVKKLSGADGVAKVALRMLHMHQHKQNEKNQMDDAAAAITTGVDAVKEALKGTHESEHEPTPEEAEAIKLFETQQRLAGYKEGFERIADVAETKDERDQVYEQGQQFLREYRQVILEDFEEQIDGAMIPIRFWYDKFIPKLLAACSIRMKLEPDEVEAGVTDDKSWYAAACARGEFNNWARDVRDGWEDLEPKEATAVRQAWRLTRHYLNGPEKLRERGSESGADHRTTGELSQYIAFIDIPLRRSYVRDENMRVSFPYFLGTATWIWKHTVAELICRATGKVQAQLVQKFKTYLQYFVTMYPCPYCRHHLNAYVILGKERELYPVEYLFLGWNPDAGGDFNGVVSLEDKIAAITDGPSVRLFLWKLHNSVNSSIAREEDWYHLERDAIATSRYWPNIDAICFKSRATGSGLVPAEKIAKAVAILKVSTKLLRMREQILHMQLDQVHQISSSVLELTKLLDERVVESGFLQETYCYDCDLINAAPKIEKIVAKTIRNQDFTID